MDEWTDIIWIIGIVGGLLSGVIGAVVGSINRYIRSYREQKRKVHVGLLGEEDFKDIQRITYKFIIWRLKKEKEKEEKKRAGISETTFTAPELGISNPTVQRWFRESRCLSNEKDKKSLAGYLDSLSNITIGEIMASDEMREPLFEVLKSANRNNQEVKVPEADTGM